MRKLACPPLGWMAIVLPIAVAGCSHKTETGYEPRLLNDSDVVQRGYYAAPFSPEARAAQQQRTIQMENRRPDLGPARSGY